jgi:hypothetical protein
MNPVTPITEFDGLDSLQERPDFDQLSAAEQIDAIEDLGRQANQAIRKKMAMEQARQEKLAMDTEFDAVSEFPLRHATEDFVHAKLPLIFNEFIQYVPELLGLTIAFFFWMILILSCLVGGQIAYSYYVAVLTRPNWEVQLMNLLHIPLFSLQFSGQWHPEYLGTATATAFTFLFFILLVRAIYKHR